MGILALYFGCGSAQAQTPVEEPPVAGRPEDFSELVGFYQIKTTAQPTTLAVENPLVLTIRITGSGPREYQPRRQKLRLLTPGLKNDFYIEPLPDQDRLLPGQNTWEFAFRLRPKRRDVQRIPGLKLVYYSPARKRFQSTYSDPITLVVTPRPVAEIPAEALKGVQPPSHFYELVTGPDVLRQTRAWELSGLIFVVLLVLPVGLCGLWYVRWRRLYPDDARLMLQRHSRSGQAALHALRDERSLTADRIFTIVTDYLRSRFEIAAAEPTPAEAIVPLARLGVNKESLQRLAALLERCDAARFGPMPQLVAADLAAQATAVVQALESGGCFAAAGRQRKDSNLAAAISVGVLLLACGLIRAAEWSNVADSESLARAERAFLEGKGAAKALAARQAFARAADSYRELQQRGIDNPDLCRNLGNASLLAGRLAEAVFAYNEGLRLAPNDASLRDDLDYARARVQYPAGAAPPASSWPDWLPLPSALFLQCSTLLFWSLACLFWTRRITTGRGTWPAILFALAALGNGGGLALLEWHAAQREAHPLVVIAADKTAVRRGNGPSYPRHPILPMANEGMEARRLTERGEWLQLEFAGGQVGWIPKKQSICGREMAGKQSPRADTLVKIITKENP